MAHRPTAYKSILAIVRKLTGQEQVVVVPRLFIEYTGSLTTAAFLARLLYWSDKGKRSDGYIWKSNREWQEETGLTGYAIRKASTDLVALGLIEVELMQAQGAPTLHYRLDQRALVDALVEYVETREPPDPIRDTAQLSLLELEEGDPDEENPDNRFCENDKSDSRSVGSDKTDLSKTTNPICRKRQIHNMAYQEEIETRGSMQTDGGARDPPSRLWEQVLTDLQGQMPRAAFDTWLRSTVGTRENGVLQVTVNHPHGAEWLDKRLRPVIERALDRVATEPVRLVFVTKGENT